MAYQTTAGPGFEHAAADDPERSGFPDHELAADHREHEQRELGHNRVAPAGRAGGDRLDRVFVVPGPPILNQSCDAAFGSHVQRPLRDEQQRYRDEESDVDPEFADDGRVGRRDREHDERKPGDRHRRECESPFTAQLRADEVKRARDPVRRATLDQRERERCRGHHRVTSEGFCLVSRPTIASSLWMSNGLSSTSSAEIAEARSRAFSAALTTRIGAAC